MAAARRGHLQRSVSDETSKTKQDRILALFVSWEAGGVEEEASGGSTLER